MPYAIFVKHAEKAYARFFTRIEKERGNNGSYEGFLVNSKIHEREEKETEFGKKELDRGTEIVESPIFGSENNMMESSILAQNERWRRVLSMQVERESGATPRRAADG